MIGLASKVVDPRVTRPSHILCRVLDIQLPIAFKGSYSDSSKGV